MKLTAIIILIACLHLSAKSLGQNQRISVDFRNSSIKDVFNEIERISDYTVFYRSEDLTDLKHVNESYSNKTVFEILDHVLNGTNLAYVLKNRVIVVLPKDHSEVVAQQIKNISGRVTDSSGAPLPGVTMVVKGTTTKGAITDADGKYSLTDVPADATLVFSFVGMRTREILVDGKTTINVVMTEESIGIEEVVAIGYGTLRKSELTSAIAKVEGDDLQARPVARLDQALQGQLAGVHVQQSGGRPGKNATIRVRGVGSISAGNDPLYVMDGFPVDREFFSNLSLDQVESVEVLKDAASAAIYGSRGSNGVIIVTTKGGKKGQELKLDLNVYAGISNIERRIDFLDSYEYLLYRKEEQDDKFARVGGDLSIPPLERPYTYSYDQNWLAHPETVPYYDHWDAVLRSPGGLQQNYSLTASGSTNKSRYLISGEFFNEEGIVKSSDYKRYSFNAKVDMDVTDFLKIGLYLSPYYSVNNDPDSEGKGGIIHSVMESTPVLPSRQGYWGESDVFDKWYIPQNHIGEIALPKIEHLKNEATRAQFQANTYAEIAFRPWLTFKTTFGANYYSSRQDRFENQVIRRTQAPMGETQDNQALNWLNENTLNFSKTLAEKHSIGGLLGFTAQKETFKSTYLKGDNYPNDLVPTLNAATQWTGNTTGSEWSLLSYLARVHYAFSDKYMFTASIRTDGSSRFGANTKWGWFPSVSAGWRIDQENWMQAIDWVSQLKLRVSWGKTGNNSIGNYSAIATLGSYTYVFGENETVVAGLAPNKISNPNLSWEMKESTDIGADLGFIQNRINLTVDWYNDLTSDLLLNVPVPASTGFPDELQNIGEVQNRGWEFELRTQNLTGAFQWTTNLNLSFLDNKVKKLGPGNAPILAGDWWGQVNYTAVGHPIGSFYLLKQTGVYNTQEEIDATPHWKGTRPGDVIIEDYSGPDGMPDKVIDAQDRQIMGSPIPTYYFGITNQFYYRGFDLSLFVNGSGGNYIHNDIGREFDGAGGWKNHFKHWENRWKSPEEPGDGKTPRANGTGATNQLTSRTLWKGDYVRLKNITLGYTFPRSIAEKLALSKLRIYLQGENLYTWDDYKVGFTPEVDLSNGNALMAGRDYGVYPSIRTFLFGVSVSF